MNARLKHRIIGAVVVVAILAIVVPLFFNQARLRHQQLLSVTLPPRPKALQQQVMNVSTKPRSAPVVQAQVTHTQQIVSSQSGIGAPVSEIVLAPKQTTPQETAVAKAQHLSKGPTQDMFNLPTPQAWVVQLGTFSNQANVQALVSKLRQHGFAAYSRSLVKNPSLTQVFVGPGINQAQVKAMQRNLKKTYGLNGVIKAYAP